MFQLNEKYKVNQRILNFNSVRYSTEETSIINTASSQTQINILRQNSSISLINSYVELSCEVIRNADISRYANVNDRRLIKLGPIALFSNYKLTISNGTHLEDISPAHIVSFLVKQKTSCRGRVDLSVRFDCDCKSKQYELTNDKMTKKIKNNYHVRNMLKVVFGFFERQEKATYGFSYELRLTRKKDNAVLSKA